MYSLASSRFSFPPSLKDFFLSYMKTLRLACPLFGSFPLRLNEIKAVILSCFIIALQDDENCKFFLFIDFYLLTIFLCFHLTVSYAVDKGKGQHRVIS